MKGVALQLIRWVNRDRRQAGMVVGLMAVGMLLWGRLLLKQVPRTASADDKPAWLVEVEAESAPGEREAVTVVRPSALDRDLFRLDPSRYLRTVPIKEMSKEAKLPEPVSDEALRMSVAKAAEGLRLQSVTLGDVPAAFINGRLIRVGSHIEGFELRSCDERSAVLEKDGIRVRLRM